MICFFIVYIYILFIIYIYIYIYIFIHIYIYILEWTRTYTCAELCAWEMHTVDCNYIQNAHYECYHWSAKLVVSVPHKSASVENSNTKFQTRFVSRVGINVFCSISNKTCSYYILYGKQGASNAGIGLKFHNNAKSSITT